MEPLFASTNTKKCSFFTGGQIQQIWIGLICAMLLSCSNTPSNPPVEAQPIKAEWHGGIQPIVATQCATCHSEGGSAPFVLDNYENVKALAEVALDSIVHGRMPPWLPDPTCAEYEDQRILSSAEIDAFKRWVEADAPLGDTSITPTPIPQSETFVPTHIGQTPEGFIPNTSESDEYRCFLLDFEFDSHQYLRGAEVIPGSAQVHHVLLYALPVGLADSVKAADSQEERPGYACFGGPEPDNAGESYENGFPTQLGAWVPGLKPTILDEGSAYRIHRGDTIVMQVHYSGVGGVSEEDKTIANLQITDIEPEKLITTKPLAIRDLEIPPGASNTHFNRVFVNHSDSEMSIRSLATHMHLLGKSQRAEIHREDGSKECALHISDWDFNWQQAYYPPTEAPVILQPGESIEVTCTYDNSPENQPIVNGVQQEPNHVTWGDGTLDEMCILYISTIEAFKPAAPEGAPRCWGIDDCRNNCGDSLDCLLSCDTVEFGCYTCIVENIYDCAFLPCPVQGINAQDCIYFCYENSVMMNGSVGDCLKATCPDKAAALLECAEPLVTGSACEGQLATCGIE